MRRCGLRWRPKREPRLLIGSAAEKIARDLDGAIERVMAGTLESAVDTAFAHAQPGDTILLAPACASFDQFQSYEHRGRTFKEFVHALKPNGTWHKGLRPTGICSSPWW